jgi:hypothetical protein
MLVTWKAISVKTLFLCAPVSGITYLSHRTLLALSEGNCSRECTKNVTINGFHTSIYPSHGHFRDINILGAEFFFRREKLTADYSELNCWIEKVPLD